MKTIADLKRDLQKGTTMTLTYSQFPHKFLNSTRFIVACKSNGIMLNSDENAKGGSFLDFPKATLAEYDGENLNIYNAGVRDLTKEEQAIKDNKPRDEKQEAQDIMTDGSVMFWRCKKYYKDLGAEYLEGHETIRGMKYNFNDKNITDDKIKGTLCLSYKIIIK